MRLLWHRSKWPPPGLSDLVLELVWLISRSLFESEKVTDATPIPPPDWEALIEQIAREMMQDHTPSQILVVRAKLYDLLTHCIPATTILKTLTFKLIAKIDEALKSDVIKWSAFYEHRIKTGTKVIFHLEAFVAKFMRTLEMYLMEMEFWRTRWWPTFGTPHELVRLAGPSQKPFAHCKMAEGLLALRKSGEVKESRYLIEVSVGLAQSETRLQWQRSLQWVRCLCSGLLTCSDGLNTVWP